MNKKLSGGWVGLLLLALLSVGLAGCGGAARAQAEPTEVPPVTSDGSVIVEGHIAPRDWVQLAFKTGGEVAELLVKEGDQVEAGQVVARLGDREQFDAAVQAAELELVNAQQALDDLNEKASLAYGQAQQFLATAELAAIDAQEELADIDTDRFEDELDDLWEKVRDAKDDLEDAQEEFDKYKDLGKDNSLRKRAEDDLETAQDDYDTAQREYGRKLNELNRAKADLAKAEAEREDAQRQVEERQSGPDPDDLALAQARLNNAQAQLASAQAALANLELKAPYAGTVVEVDVALNEHVLPNQPAVLLADFSAWYVETSDLTEMEVVRIDTKMPVMVQPDALEELQLAGQIERVSQGFEEQGGDITYEARILLTEFDSRLRWGMTVQVSFNQ